MSFFSTVAGKRVGAALAGVASIAGFGASWLPQTVFLDKYRSFYQFFVNDFILEIDDKLKGTIDEVMRQVKLPEAKKKQITLFLTSSIDPFAAGSTETGYGAIVGVPYSFVASSVDEINKESISVGNIEIDWTWPAGKLYRESFVLSDKAKKYAIAQNIYLADSRQLRTQSLASCGCILNVYILSKVLNTRLSTYPTPVRYVVYSLSTVIGLIAYFAITDMATYSNERSALDKATALGKDYSEGAVEYYQKAIVKNKTLRVLLKNKGHSMFTPQGERRTLVRTKHMPLQACYDRAKHNMDVLDDTK